mmetsp:Transcript_10122/g.23426  ORF Transcript_10122/g.23426 Transcript_10122/m.23426 type:complete len:94 (-) Transcript_10122:348-629(-)
MLAAWVFMGGQDRHGSRWVRTWLEQQQTKILAIHSAYPTMGESLQVVDLVLVLGPRLHACMLCRVPRLSHRDNGIGLEPAGTRHSQAAWGGSQ